MKYKLSYLDTALEDIADINLYLEQFYPSTAKKIFNKMEEQTVSLQERPFLWPEYERRPEYRKMIVEDYLVFYHVDDETKTVEIRRMLHGSRNLEQQIK